MNKGGIEVKSYECPRCHSRVSITRDQMHKSWVERGYKYEYMGYFHVCPICGQKVELDPFRLPLNVKLKFIKEWLTAK